MNENRNKNQRKKLRKNNMMLCFVVHAVRKEANLVRMTVIRITITTVDAATVL